MQEPQKKRTINKRTSNANNIDEQKDNDNEQQYYWSGSFESDDSVSESEE